MTDLPKPTFRWNVRFSPHILVLLLTLLVAIPPLRGAIVSFVHWWWSASYVQIDYVMDEARPNDGAPYIAGHLEGSTEQTNLVGSTVADAIVVKALPQEAFAPGKRLRIWHSAEAPSFVVFGREVNDLPVAALPSRPGLLHLLGYLLWLLATWIVGILAMAWVKSRWSRSYGNLPFRRTKMGLS